MKQNIIKNIEEMKRMKTMKSENMPYVVQQVWDAVLGNDKEGICCICGKNYDNYGNNAKPYKDGRCCDECNEKMVLPMRAAIRTAGFDWRRLREGL